MKRLLKLLVFCSLLSSGIVVANPVADWEAGEIKKLTDYQKAVDAYLKGLIKDQIAKKYTDAAVEEKIQEVKDAITSLIAEGSGAEIDLDNTPSGKGKAALVSLKKYGTDLSLASLKKAAAK